MEKRERKNVYKVYNKIALWFSENRATDLQEKGYLDFILDKIPVNGTILDLGCGTGKPILEYLVRCNVDVIGVDASEEMLNIAKASFPSISFLLQDMRLLDLNRKFDAMISWNSLFHLSATDQQAMFPIIKKHLNPMGLLLFTSGTERGEAWGMNGGKHLFHASLNTKDYEQLLIDNNFKVLKHVVNDPDCAEATIWIAQYCPTKNDQKYRF
ncbi:class I SAM-dependent methyltransferase [Mucilaginibacter sp. HD30]